MATQQEIMQCRYELGDLDSAFPMLTDAEYSYFLDKNNSSVRRASLDAAKTILFKLSMRSDETVDLFSIKGSKAAENYRMALTLFIKDPNLNPVYNLTSIYAGGISKSDMQANNDMFDNNAVRVPTDIQEEPRQTPFDI